MSQQPDPIYFADAAALRAWLDEHAATASDLWVGLYKVSSGKAGMRWPELVDEVLAVGWIDATRKTVDDERYVIRIVPRKTGSRWSQVNIQRVAELTVVGRMRPAGLAAFEARKQIDGAAYSYERTVELSAEQETEFRANPAAWTYFNAQPASYRRAAIWWVVGAKRDDTRERRLAELITISARGERLRQFQRKR
ncbi:MAG: YdeI/OmpD-associated family protein [Thermomicrobiales bacterium]|nr:YdeI/OmpD-associated family protein [Thermomicrobiales bacterium]